jgi:hypothetical protein
MNCRPVQLGPKLDVRRGPEVGGAPGEHADGVTGRSVRFLSERRTPPKCHFLVTAGCDLTQSCRLAAAADNRDSDLP